MIKYGTVDSNISKTAQVDAATKEANAKRKKQSLENTKTTNNKPK